MTSFIDDPLVTHTLNERIRIDRFIRVNEWDTYRKRDILDIEINLTMVLYSISIIGNL